MQLLIRLQEPSGARRTYRYKPTSKPARIGRDPESDFVLRDFAAAPRAAELTTREGRPWIVAVQGAPALRLGDWKVREAELPLGARVSIGETQLEVTRLEESRENDFPSGVRPWLSVDAKGRELLNLARKTAATPLAIYLQGDTGTGKEVLAELIHRWSPRAQGPFVPLHCAALPLSLAESELFGHVKGAFTGASSSRLGALLQAHTGTLFLDEVGDLPADIQVKLLRFLENGELRPVGSDRTVVSDVRILCATHQDLEKLVEEGKFRRDLFYRLASVTLKIPALRDRPADIAHLAEGFALKLGRTISDQATLRLQAHAWPGNVRELRHAIERACGLAPEGPPVLGEAQFAFLTEAQATSDRVVGDLGSAALSLKEMERLLVLKAMRLSGGNRNDAAQLLGCARSTLFLMLKRHQIAGPRTFKRPPTQRSDEQRTLPSPSHA